MKKDGLKRWDDCWEYSRTPCDGLFIVKWKDAEYVRRLEN